MVANILSIAGTDPTGGAGIQADINMIAAIAACSRDASSPVRAARGR